MTRKIKSVTVFKYDFPQGESNRELIPDKYYKHSYTEMSSSGEIVLDIKFLTNGEPEERIVRKLNEQGHPVEEILYLPEDEIADHKSFVTDEKGNVLAIKQHYADGTFDTIHLKYNHKGRIVEKTTVDSDNEAESKEVFIYNGDRLTEKQSWEYGELISKESYSYDENGKVNEIRTWKNDGDRERIEQFWDEKDRLVKILTYDEKEKLTGRMLYSYDEAGRLTGSDYETVKGRVITNVRFDEQGNAVEQTETNGKGEINHTVTRKYNEWNDVTEAKVFIEHHGRDVNEEYVLKYEYMYFED